MTKRIQLVARRIRRCLWLAPLVLAGTLPAPTLAATLPVTLPVMSCEALAKVDLSRLDGAPTKINLTRVDEASAQLPTRQCFVSGYVAQDIAFNVRLPLDNWTGRLVMQGCGGYCGTLITLPLGYGASAANDCPRFVSGEIALAAHNGGHVGQTNSSRFLASISDGSWAADNPDAPSPPTRSRHSPAPYSPRAPTRAA